MNISRYCNRPKQTSTSPLVNALDNAAFVINCFPVAVSVSVAVPSFFFFFARFFFHLYSRQPSLLSCHFACLAQQKRAIFAFFLHLLIFANSRRRFMPNYCHRQATGQPDRPTARQSNRPTRQQLCKYPISFGSVHDMTGSWHMKRSKPKKEI